MSQKNCVENDKYFRLQLFGKKYKIEKKRVEKLKAKIIKGTATGLALGMVAYTVPSMISKGITESKQTAVIEQFGNLDEHYGINEDGLLLNFQPEGYVSINTSHQKVTMSPDECISYFHDYVALLEKAVEKHPNADTTFNPSLGSDEIEPLIAPYMMENGLLDLEKVSALLDDYHTSDKFWAIWEPIKQGCYNFAELYTDTMRAAIKDCFAEFVNNEKGTNYTRDNIMLYIPHVSHNDGKQYFHIIIGHYTGPTFFEDENMDLGSDLDQEVRVPFYAIDTLTNRNPKTLADLKEFIAVGRKGLYTARVGLPLLEKKGLPLFKYYDADDKEFNEAANEVLLENGISQSNKSMKH